MLANQPEYRIRNVVIPDDCCGNIESIRSKVWEQGQNMFQNQPCIVSVSQGDVMEIKGMFHLILNLGFLVLTREEFDTYTQLPQEARRRLLWDDSKVIWQKIHSFTPKS